MAVVAFLLAAAAASPASVLVADPDPRQRREAAQRLRAARDPASTGPLLAALEDSDGEVRGIAASALGRLGAVEAIPRLATLLVDDVPFTREQAAEALSALAREDAAATALDDVWSEAEPLVRERLVPALAHASHRVVLGRVGSALGDEHAGVRAAAWRVLRLSSRETTIPALEGCLRAPSEKSREACAQLAGELRLATLARPLAALAANDLERPNVRRAAHAAVLKMKEELDAPELAKAARESKDRSERADALSVLALLADERSYVALLHGLDDPDEYVRATAASGLGDFGDKRAVGALSKAAGETRNARIKKTIERALERLLQGRPRR